MNKFIISVVALFLFSQAVYAYDITLLKYDEVVLSTAEASKLGIKGKLTYERPLNEENELQITIPKDIDGVKFRSAIARLFHNQLSVTTFKAAEASLESGQSIILINVNPDIVTEVKVFLYYGNSSKYEISFVPENI